MDTIATIAALNTAATDLGPHAAKPTATTDDVTEASVDIWTSGLVETGLWECTPGSFTATREGYTEICTILSGRVSLEVEGQGTIVFGPGDVMVMPSGWVGIWHVHEHVRKHYTIIHDA